MSRPWMVRDDKLGEPHRSDYYCAEKCHPVVVIDPTDIPHLSEFAGDPRRALHMIAEGVRAVAGDDLDATENLVYWLAEQMPMPPKPAEPLGLGAVVEDVDGKKWVRSDDSECVNPWHRNGTYEDREYAAIDAVKVLSEGVTA